MATYKSSKELEGKVLSLGDILEYVTHFDSFKLVYRVRETYLENISGSSNAEIFKQLAIED